MTGQAQVRLKGKIRMIILPRELCALLKKYIKEKHITSGSVFVTRKGQPVDRHSIWKSMKQLCECAGVSKEKVFPHNLRHPYVKLKLKNLFSLYCSLNCAEILHFPYNLNSLIRINIHFIYEPVSQAL